MKLQRRILVGLIIVCICDLIGVAIALDKYCVMYRQTHRPIADIGESVLYPPVMPYDGVHTAAVILADVSAVFFIAVLVCFAVVMGLRWTASLRLVSIILLPLLWLVALSHAIAMHIDWYNNALYMQSQHGIGDFGRSWHVRYDEWVVVACLLFTITLVSFVIWVRSHKPQFNWARSAALIAYAVIFIISSISAWLAYRMYLTAFYHRYDGPVNTTAIGLPSFSGHVEGKAAAIILAVVWALSAIGMISVVARVVRLRWQHTMLLLFSILLPILWLCGLGEALFDMNRLIMTGGYGPGTAPFQGNLIAWTSVTILLFIAFLASFQRVVKQSVKGAAT